MHDAPLATEPFGTHSDAGSEDVIEHTLDRFRGYLRELHHPVDPPVREPAPFDWATLAAQFTALRHDVNLQTKAVRTATEQTAEVLKAIPKVPDTSSPQPSLKAILEIADALALARKQVERTRESLGPQVIQFARSLNPPEPTKGLFARWFGGKRNDAGESDSATVLIEKLAPTFAGLADGYSMSLQRVENLLEQLGLQPIESTGRPFDPELMEVLEVAVGSGRAPGTVLEEFRRGYRREGKVFRFAQVKVAR